MGAGPGPGFLAAVFVAHLQQVVVGLQLTVHIGLVPGLEGREALHNGVFGIDGFGSEGAGLMAFELAAHHFDVSGGVAEAPGSRMDGDQAFAAFDKLG
jgi:hypothetical protein